MPDLIKPAEDIPITELRGSLMSSVSGQTITCRKPNRGFLVIKMDGWASPNPIPIYMAGRLLDHPMQESQVRKTSFKMARNPRATEWISGCRSRNQTSPGKGPCLWSYCYREGNSILPIRQGKIQVMERIKQDVLAI